MRWPHLLSRTRAVFLRDRHLAPAPTWTGSVLELTELEDRILMSAMPLAPDAMPDLDPTDSDAAADLASDSLHAPATDTPWVPLASTDVKPGPGACADSNESTEVLLHADDARHELVFIDSSVSGYQELLAKLADRTGGEGSFTIALLTGHEDGIAQISSTLQQYDQLDAVHFLSHGTSGSLKLGSTWLDATRLGAYAGMITGWADALAPGADLLFYQCDLAATPQGLAVLEGIHALTGADVAASVDSTGHPDVGGDWELEHHHGSIETAVVLGAEARLQWWHRLASEYVRDDFLVQTFAGNDGSVAWIGDWQELGEADGPTTGDVQVMDYDLGPEGAYSLQLQAVDGVGLGRELDLSAASSATLSFSWQRQGFVNAVLDVQMSADAGTSWTTLTTIPSGNDVITSTSTFDVSTFASSQSQLRFVVTGSVGGCIYIDQVSIDYETVAAAPNTAPVLVSGNDLSLADILEDDYENSGNTVASILASAGDDRVTDVDDGALEGIAVIGVDNTHGHWQFDALGDGPWVDFSETSDLSAVLLSADSRVRFVPQADFAGMGGQIQFRAWDQTTGAVGDTGVDVSVNGGETAFSSATDGAGITVLSVDDPPRLALPSGLFVLEDTELPITGLSVLSVDPADTEMEFILSVAHGTLTFGATNGLAFTSGDGAGDSELIFTGSVDDINVALATLTYLPHLDFNGTDTLNIQASDWSAVGGSQLSTSGSVTVAVGEVNDPPIAFPQRYSVRGDDVLVVEAPGILHDAVDTDGDPLAVRLVRAPWHGKLFWNADGSFRYVPDPSFLGTDSFVYVAADGQAESVRTRVFVTVLVPISPVDPSSTVPGNASPSGNTHLPAVPELLPGLTGGPTAEISKYMSQGEQMPRLRSVERETHHSEADADPEGMAAFVGTVSYSLAADDAVHRSSARAYAADEGMESTSAVADPLPISSAWEASLSTALLSRHELSSLDMLLDDHSLWHRWMVGSAAGVTAGLTVGYVLWTVRAGYLVTSLIAQMPAWRYIDPLPILRSFDGQVASGDGESLSSIAEAGDARVAG